MTPVRFAYFGTSHAAWRFMFDCEARGWVARFPSFLPGPDGYSVEYREVQP